MFEYLKAFLETHRGLGLAGGIDQVLLQRICFGQQQAGGKSAAVTESDEWKAMKAEVKALKGELAATKNELKQVRAGPKPSGGPPGQGGACHYTVV